MIKKRFRFKDIVLVLVAFPILCFPGASERVFADAGKQVVMDDLRAAFNVNEDLPVPNRYVKTFADFLNADDYTPEELEYFRRSLDTIGGIIDSGEHLADIDMNLLMQLQNEVFAAATNVGANLSIEGVTIVITTRTGRRFTMDAMGLGIFSVPGLESYVAGMSWEPEKIIKAMDTL
jgi:hypothetical protein